MNRSFYGSSEYRKKQAEITRRNVARGLYAHLKKREHRICARPDCEDSFEVIPASPKRYCSRRCAAKVNNSGRTLSLETKNKIAKAATGKKSPFKGLILVERLTGRCENPACNAVFTYEQYKKRKYCSKHCAIVVNGSKPTSPKASRGKAGIRSDISNAIYFYSRWEANMARLYTFSGVVWEYAPKTFDIGGQTYTPDFYLPESDTYVEVKNFWGTYSRIRDTKFRKAFPSIHLKVLLKDEYVQLEKRYAKFIPTWEYKNSVFV